MSLKQWKTDQKQEKIGLNQVTILKQDEIELQHMKLGLKQGLSPAERHILGWGLSDFRTKSENR